MSIQLLSNKGVIADIKPNIKTSIKAQKGLIYFFTKDNVTPTDVVASRTEDNLVLSSAKNNAAIEIEGFFTVCAAHNNSDLPSGLITADSCLVKLDVYALGTGYSTTTITPNGQTLSSFSSGDVGTLLPNTRIANINSHLTDKAVSDSLQLSERKPFPWLLTAAGVGGTALAVGLASQGGSDDNNQANSISISTANLDSYGAITLAGNTQAFATVLIVAGNTTFTTQANSDGVYQLKTNDNTFNANTADLTIKVYKQNQQGPSASTSFVKPTIDLFVGSDSGDSNSDNITSFTRPTLSGKAIPGAIVKVYDSLDNLVATATAASNGDWSATLNSSLNDGEYAFYAKSSHPLDKQATATEIKSATTDVIIDAVIGAFTTAPTLTLASDGSLTFTGGITDPNLSSIKITFQDGETYSTSTNDSGEIDGTFKSGPNLPSGNVTVQATNVAGKVQSFTFFYQDITPPNEPTILERLTDDNGLTIRTLPGGIALQGSAEPNSTVEITFPATTVTLAFQEYTVDADTTIEVPELEISLPDEPFVNLTIYYPDGVTQTYTTDQEGKVTIPERKDITPNINSQYTNAKGENTSSVYVLYNRIAKVTVQADSEGKWETPSLSEVQTDPANLVKLLSPAHLPDGDITATATDQDGNQSTATTLRFTDDTAPEITSLLIVEPDRLLSFNQIQKNSVDAIIAIDFEAYSTIDIMFNGVSVDTYESKRSLLTDQQLSDTFYKTDLDPNLLTEGKHTLSIKVTDKSELETTESIVVWVGDLLIGTTTLDAGNDVILIDTLNRLTSDTTYDALAGFNTLVLAPQLSVNFELTDAKLKNIDQIDMTVDFIGLSFGIANSVTLSFADALEIGHEINGLTKLLISGDDSGDEVTISDTQKTKDTNPVVIDGISYSVYRSSNSPNVEILVEQSLTVL